MAAGSKKGGCFLNFDSNFLFSLYDEELKRQHEINEKEAVKMGYVPTPNDHLADGMDKILPEFSSASHHRPQWDMENLINMDFKKSLWIKPHTRDCSKVSTRFSAELTGCS